jgi:hypothetical protein
MTLHMIKLSQAWTFDEAAQLGETGGFGDVFRGKGDYGAVAIKRLKLTRHQAADRELKIAEHLKDKRLKHVVPILDSGLDTASDRYFIVMPLCDGSLEAHLAKSGGKLPQPEAISVLMEIMSGLQEVREIIHRDLKPANVLRHNGVWKVADFGIAKFVEDSTSLQTLKGFLSRHYAAPEQWRDEAATPRTDVYALGCIAHRLIAGQPPFMGTPEKSIRDQHLTEPPPTLSSVNNKIATLISLMLRKSPQMRPSLGDCLEQLTASVNMNIPATPAVQALADAARQIADEQARVDAAVKATVVTSEKRQELAIEGIHQLRGLRDQLIDRLLSQSAGFRENSDGLYILGQGYFLFRPPEDRGNVLPPNGEYLGLDVVTSHEIALCCTSLDPAKWDRSGSGYTFPYYTRRAALYLGCRSNESRYRWYEMAFFDPKHTSRPQGEPFGDWGYYAVNGLGSHQVAYGPLPIDGEDHESFLERWISLFAKAVLGKLLPPDNFPMKSPL